METAVAMVPGGVVRRDHRTRVMSVIAATALVLAAFVLIQQPAEASPPSAAVASIVAGASGASAVTAQINFGGIFCSILQSILAAFQNSPFFAFVAAAIQSLLVAFGCDPSPG